MGLFRVKAGQHSEGGRTYRKDDVVETAADLAAFDAGKFERLPDPKAAPAPPAEPAPPAPPPARAADGLDSLTVAQLRQRAEAEEVDLVGLRTKDEILAALRGAGAG